MENKVNYINEIALNELTPTDEIVIRTENSEYQFSVTDPAQRHGILSGGSQGRPPGDAVLVGSVGGRSAGSGIDTAALKTGARALFFVNADGGLVRLNTSAIRRLTLLRGDA